MTVLGRPGGDLLSRVLRQSTIGAKAFDGRVRDGIGSNHLAKATRPAKNSPRFWAAAFKGKQNWVWRVANSEWRIDSIRHEPFAISRSRYSLAGASPRAGDKSNQVERAISTGQLRALLRFHIRPIDVVVFHGSSGRTCFEAGFPLRCLQRLSIPHIATLHHRWRDDRSTRDVFTPVLSY